ncbi:hypothetical protein P879_03729 [Paragonimus westermani]|uniref:Uncharacterized protein n=1 Tax=Paragonimus westermani TaxID=34504 RepID=A0A8T0DGW6_9TREM|nr:hypothetical protein P879_03729 [Paragonimus westermani]
MLLRLKMTRIYIWCLSSWNPICTTVLKRKLF